MLRFFFPALALVGLLAAAQPCFADPSPAAPASDLVQAAAAPEQLSPEAAMSRSSDAAATQATAAAGLSKNAAPVGFGWG